MTEPVPSATDSAPATPEGAVHGPQALAAAVAALLHAARREVRLFSPQLNPLVFNTAAVAAALARFIAQHPRNRARVLVEDRSQLLRDNGRLINLARRLADGVELREVEDNARGARDMYALADRSLFMVQEDILRSDAIVSAHAPHEAIKLVERFEAAWERGNAIALRTLGL